MHFGFAIDSSDVGLFDKDLDLLDTDVASKYFVCLQGVLKTSLGYVFKTSSRHVFKTPSKHDFMTPSRRLQRNSFSSSKTSWKTKHCYTEDVLKTNKYLLGLFSVTF